MYQDAIVVERSPASMNDALGALGAHTAALKANLSKVEKVMFGISVNQFGGILSWFECRTCRKPTELWFHTLMSGK